jgi:glyoxylate/hydroxypyruvate reductase A
MGQGVLAAGLRGRWRISRFRCPAGAELRQVPGMRRCAGAEQFGEFLARTRILVCLLPLTPETNGIMNAKNLSRLMPGGYVINVARGAHLVDDDLIALLDSGHMAGAALDVFRTEPLPAEHPFWHHPGIPSRRTPGANAARRPLRRSPRRSRRSSGRAHRRCG